MKRTLAMLAAGLALAGCHDATSPVQPATPITKLPRALTASECTLVVATSGFAFNLLNAEAGIRPDDNLFLSPLSASAALGLAANGAAGATLDSMQRVLGLDGQSMLAMDSAYQTLFALLTSLDPNVQITIANAAWYDQHFSVLPGFASRAQTFFNAPVTALDFRSASAPSTINDWVDRNTRGKISSLIDSIPSTWVVFLADAVYFSAPWHRAFDPSKTHVGTFHLESGGTAPITLMDGHDSVSVVRSNDYIAVDLPYAGSAFSMTIVLPLEGSSVEAVTAELANGGWASLVASLQPTDRDVSIPKMQLDWQDHLPPALIAMGMGAAFANEADFSQLSAKRTKINDVIQKTYVSVDEHGTTAAGVTGVGIQRFAVEPPIVVDHPYVFAIREKLSGAVLFTGRIMTPPAA